MRRLLTCLVALAALAAAPPARADVYDDSPAAASSGAGDYHVFVRAADGTILERHTAGVAWSDWTSFGGTAISGPAAASYGTSMHVMVAGSNGAIYDRYLSDGAWSNWTATGKVTSPATSAPSMAQRRGTGYFDVAYKGTDNAIWFSTFIPGQGYTDFVSLGGSLSSAPAVSSQADGIVNVFARGADCQLFQKYYLNGAWSGWFALGGCIAGAPTVISRAPNVLDVYARGTDGGLYQLHWDAAGWAPWVRVDPTALGSAPAGASDAADHEVLFSRSGANLITKAWGAASGWTGWADFGPAALPASAAPPPPSPPPAPRDGEVDLVTGVRCTPAGGRLRVHIAVRKAKGQAKARVTRIVFYTKGKGRTVRVDRTSPFVVRMKVNRPAGTSGRVYARVYYKRSRHGKVHRKVVSRRYTVCR